MDKGECFNLITNLLKCVFELIKQFHCENHHPNSSIMCDQLESPVLTEAAFFILCQKVEELCFYCKRKKMKWKYEDDSNRR